MNNKHNIFSLFLIHNSIILLIIFTHFLSHYLSFPHLFFHQLRPFTYFPLLHLPLPLSPPLFSMHKKIIKFSPSHPCHSLTLPRVCVCVSTRNAECIYIYPHVMPSVCVCPRGGGVVTHGHGCRSRLHPRGGGRHSHGGGEIWLHRCVCTGRKGCFIYVKLGERKKG